MGQRLCGLQVRGADLDLWDILWDMEFYYYWELTFKC